MKIGGLLKFSFINYPEKLSAVVFTQGCNFRCPYCHNPELVLPKYFRIGIPEGEVLAFLEKRRQQLEGVVVTGGEPTIQKDLINFLQKVKSMGYLLKLDSNGSRPDVLKEIIRLKLVDYIAMDIKVPLEKYYWVTDGKDYTSQIQESINLITGSGLDHEFRTTVVKPHISPQEDLPKIAQLIPKAKRYHLQQFFAHENVLEATLVDAANYSTQEIADMNAQYGIG